MKNYPVPEGVGAKRPDQYNSVKTRVLMFVLAFAHIGEGLGRLLSLTRWNPRIVGPVVGALARTRFELEMRSYRDQAEC